MAGDVVRPDGPQVRKLRKAKGWTQEDLAKRIRARAGSFSKRTLEKIEAGRPVHLRSIRVVAEELGIDVAAILHDHDAALHNLPFRLTSFIGRENECAEISHLLGHERLVTLTGTGGCGKSRLALEVTTDLVTDYPDGVWLVELAALADPALVPQAVARALSVREEPRRPLTETLIRDLKRKRTLILLDNCEHLLSACTELVGALLPACAELRILATSRESMNFAGETVYSVPALRLPDANREFQLDELHEVESVRLFVERAAAVRSDFSLSESNVRAVVEICEHLDGIPLALELAAARVRAISADEIARRLDDRFHVLSDGHRAVLPQHRTLRALIDWSYDLLSDDERTLLRRLSVFAGGCTLQAAERVCAGDGIEQGDVLDLLSHLVSKSLVEMRAEEDRDTGTARYRLLETVREYARDRSLDERGESDASRHRHLQFFLELAEEAQPHLVGPDQAAWFSRLDAEYDNMRAAFAAWSGTDGQFEIGLRLLQTLARYVDIRGHWSEGAEMCAQVLARSDAGESSPGRAKILGWLGSFARSKGDHGRARSAWEAGLAVYRELEDRRGIARLLGDLGMMARDEGRYSDALSLFEESLDVSRALEDKRAIADALNGLGAVSMAQESYADAQAFFEESLALNKELKDCRGISLRLGNLAGVASLMGDQERARALYESSLEIKRELGDMRGVANALIGLGNVASAQGDRVGACSLFEESLAIGRELGEKRLIAYSLHNLGADLAALGELARPFSLCREALTIFRDLEDRKHFSGSLWQLGELAAAREEPTLAARLLGAAEALRLEIGTPPPAGDCVATLRKTLGDEAFAREWAYGQAMSLEEAIECAQAADRS